MFYYVGKKEYKMLRIFYGDMSEPSAYGPSWFKYGYEPVWFEDPFDVEILNAKCIVHTADDLILTCLDFI